MTCDRCEGKGFVEYFQSYSAGFKPSLYICPKCKDATKYSQEVQRRFAKEPVQVSTGQVLAFTLGKK